MEDTFEQQHRRWPWILLLAAILMLLIVFGGHWIWSTGAGRRLEHQAAVYRSAGEPIELIDFVTRDVPDEENAVIDLRAAARSIDSGSEHGKAFDNLDPALPLADKEINTIAAFVADNKPAFDGVDLAMTKKGVDWKIPWKSPSIGILLPDLSQQRGLATLFSRHAMLAHQNGDDATVLRDFARIHFIADAVDQQPLLVSHLVGTGIRALVCDQIEAIGPDLKIGASPAASRDGIKKLIALLLDDRPIVTGLHRGLTGERALELDTARCVSAGTLSLTSLTSPRATPTTPAGSALGYVAKPIALGDGLIMIRHVTATMEAADKSATWPAFVAIAPPEPPEVLNSPYRHALARIMMPSFDRSVQTNFRCITERRFAAIVLATALYRADHGGKFPFKLDDLVPEYLPALPADPMATGAPIKYIPATTQPIIYSVGEDGTDSGGNENSQTSRPATSRWNMLDAVLHLTRQPRPPIQESEPLSGVDAENIVPATTQATTSPSTEPPPTR